MEFNENLQKYLGNILRIIPRILTPVLLHKISICSWIGSLLDHCLSHIATHLVLVVVVLLVGDALQL